MRHLKIGIWNLEFGIWNLEFGIWYAEFGIWNLEFGIWNLEFGIWNLEKKIHRLKNFNSLLQKIHHYLLVCKIHLFDINSCISFLNHIQLRTSRCSSITVRDKDALFQLSSLTWLISNQFV